MLVMAKIHETCMGALVERKTGLYIFFCEDVNADDTFCSNDFTFPFMLRTG